MDVYREDGDDSIDVFKACRNKMEIRCEQGVAIQANTLAGILVPKAIRQGFYITTWTSLSPLAVIFLHSFQACFRSSIMPRRTGPENVRFTPLQFHMRRWL